MSHPAWSYNTNIYELNVRQYTPEGTFKAFQKHLPRLKDMGVEILWFMPVTPISVKDRKGTLGSYYAVQNYKAINPEFGDMEDFKDLVRTAHQFGFKIIIDWVANHTGNDNVWIAEHPDFFVYENGNILHPNGWEDVSKLNFDNTAMQQEMINAMQYWITEADIDGFRCDMAHLVPLHFWVKAKEQISKTNPDLFWLAECEEPLYHEVFDSTYTWQWMHKTEAFIKKETNVDGLKEVLEYYNNNFTEDAYRIFFTSNHDENSWNGTEYEKYGEAAKALSVLSCTWGLPLVYSGQELPNNKRLKFFDKDVIEWKPECELHSFYKTLLQLRKTNDALMDGNTSERTIAITDNENVLAFLRKKENNEVWVVLNLSAEKVACKITSPLLFGKFKNIFTGIDIILSNPNIFELTAWQYMVYEKRLS